MNFKLPVLSFIILNASCLVNGQERNEILDPLAKGYIERSRVMEKGKNYAGVIDQTGFTLTDGSFLSAEEEEERLYLRAIALYERGDAGCVDLLREFADTYPASWRSPKALLAAADYFFYARHYANALAAYMDMDPDRLDPEDRRKYDYNMALSMVKSGLLNEAEGILKNLRDEPEFNVASDYYLAYIEYARGNYDKAYEGFQKVKTKNRASSETGIWPEYYINQIDFIKEDYEKVASASPSLLRNPKDTELIAETERVAGLSNYKTGNHEEAERYLTSYISTPNYSLAPDAIYTLGEIFYKDGRRAEAATLFNEIADEEDAIGQGAILYLGQIAVEEGDSDASAILFQKASEMDYDSKLTETALYNYTVAATKGNSVPFSSAMPLMSKFVEKFPESEFADDIRKSMATVLFNEGDFEKALKHLDDMKYLSKDDKILRQKALLALGIRQAANNNLQQAIQSLRKAAEANADSETTERARLWLGDALYSNGDYAASEQAFREYINSRQKGDEEALAYYNLGYSLLMQEKYSSAANAFSKSLTGRNLSKNLKDDATIRLADMQYYGGEYKKALEGYTKAIENGAAASDYAYYRKAVMTGLTGHNDQKLKQLENMETQYPQSRWLPYALREAGQTYAAAGKYTDASRMFEKLRKYQDSPEIYRSGMLELANSYMKSGEYKNGEKIYREIISEWPTSEESRQATDELKTYYSEYGGLREFASYLRSIEGAPSLNENEIEKLQYEAAATAYSSGGDDIILLQQYVEDYPDGTYLAESLLDIAITQNERGENSKALETIETLLSKRKDSPQVAEALSLKASILYDSGVANHEEALATYRQLESTGGNDFKADAYIGIMRLTDNNDERLQYARLVKSTGGIPAEIVEEADYYEAVVMLPSGNQESEQLLKEISKGESEAAAKSAVTLGQYYLDKGRLKDAKTTLESFTKKGTNHSYWLARGFITLADVYHAEGKDYLGIEYLKSLKANYPGKELDIQDMINSRISIWEKE